MYSILYEDDNILIINKESGYLVHKTQYDDQPNIIDHINLHKGTHYLVHRIDKFTSGTLLLAKNKDTLKKLQSLFQLGQIQKTYLAILSKPLPAKKVQINLSLGRSKNNRLIFSNKNAKNLKKSCTNVEILIDTLVKVVIKTGRTHQIRAHLKEINCPILNDPIYGFDCFDQNFGQFLHAHSLKFVCPITNREIFVSAPIPVEFSNKLSELNIGIEEIWTKI